MVSHLNENAIPETPPNKSVIMILKIVNDQKEKARLEEVKKLKAQIEKSKSVPE